MSDEIHPHGYCPRCRPDERITNPTVIARGEEWDYCMFHALRWSTGPATESPPASGDDGAYFLRLFAQA